jgi:hypothetical protein
MLPGSIRSLIPATATLRVPCRWRPVCVFALLLLLHGWSHAAQVILRDLAVTIEADDRPQTGAGLQLLVLSVRGRGTRKATSLQMPLKPAPRSALLSHPGMNIQVGTVDAGGYRIEGLAYVSELGQLTVLAAGIEEASRNVTSWYWFCQPSDNAGTQLNLAALEHLYGMALKQPATRVMRFQMAACRKDACKGSLTRGSLPTLLAHLAGLRAAEAASANLPVVPWTVVTVRAVRIGADVSMPMRVRLLEGKRPLAKERVVLERAPHHACSALTWADGTAECVLQDMHGTGHEHEEASSPAPVVASYPGQVGRDVIRLPTAVPLLPGNRVQSR